MAKQTFFVDTMVHLSDTLVDSFDVVDVLTMLSSRCAELLGVSAAAVLLTSPAGDLTYLASSKHSTAELDLFHSEVAEGPGLTCLKEQRPLSWELEEAWTRWPQFASKAIEAGFHSGHSIPMRLRDRAIGVLSIMRIESGHMDDNEFAMARGLADLAAITVLTNEASSDAARVNQQLSTALDSRIVIEQAKGMISQEGHCDMHVAFETLRSYARNNNILLSKVAKDLVSGSLSVRDVPLWVHAD